jgi:hypothetical protein
VASFAPGISDGVTLPASMTGINACKNTRSRLRRTAKPQARSLDEQPLRLAVKPAVAR